MDLTAIGYLLFVIPGFCMVWSYRHFTKAKQIGEFEYAIWSFLWGSSMLLSVIKFGELRSAAPLPLPSMDNPFLFAAASLGMGLAASTIAFVLGYVGAFFFHLGLFSSIDKFLFWLIKEVTGEK